MSEDPAAPVVALEGVLAGTGSAFIPDYKFPGTTRLRTAVGTTLLFAIVNHPRATDPDVRDQYQHHRHDFRDAELVVNGETYSAVEVRDSEIGIRVRAASVNGFTVVATVPVDQDVPGVSVTWPEGNDA